MVKVKDDALFASADGSINVEQWLKQLSEKGYVHDLELIRHACALSQTEAGTFWLQQGLIMADVLVDLEVDQETLIATLVFLSAHHGELSFDEIEEELGSGVAKLVKGVEKMSAINTISPINKYQQNKQQLDNVRKMLLAMVDDARVVLIKLAERLCILRFAGSLTEEKQIQLASEAMEIYAPLANRLGIGAIKWELEDLAFRYLHPIEYKAIAKSLKAKRLERDNYVHFIVEELTTRIKEKVSSHFAVYGRSKHIHSIYRKMMRKNVALEKIYDATAVRVLVDTVEACYDVLGIVHALWRQIPEEFDDYIINAKPNGYQSLHTAVEGPEGQVFEVQIRTFQMHELAEMGVAAHWKYKEGGKQQKQSHERRIAWLRDVLSWHSEMATSSGVSEASEKEFLEDRVYVFTPDGDVLDLPHGATPLDFAYHVHSQLGHRCRGAKINNTIVPLTYELKTGDKVEILTGKAARPSRDWINPHLSYLKTSRAKAKVVHWFRMQDYDKNKADGQELLDKSLKHLAITSEQLQDVVTSFNFKRLDDFLAALGRGEIKINQIVHRLTPIESQTLPSLVKPQRLPEGSGDLKIEGVGNLLTIMARCCRPVPGDAIIGYITLGRGVSIHRQDCSNILHANEKQRRRLIEVSWGLATHNRYGVDISVKAFDRTGLLKDVTALLANEKAHVFALQTKLDKEEHLVFLSLSIEIEGLSSLSRLLNKLEQIPNVFEVRRQH